MNLSEETLSKFSLGLIMFGFLVVVASIVLFSFQTPKFDLSMSIDAERFSFFGQFIGGLVGSMWALASVLLIFVNLSLQRRALQHQREQLTISKQEIEAQIDQLSEQAQRFREERSEATFFQLLTIHHAMISNMEAKLSLDGGPATTKHGRECFLALYRLYKQEYYAKEAVTEPAARIDASFERFFEKYQEVLGHYLRNLYRIFKFLDESAALSEESKVSHAKLLRAQLSNYELLLLFYNCLSRYGKKFKVYAIRYQLFDNLIKSKLIDPQGHELLYDKNAFGGQARQ